LRAQLALAQAQADLRAFGTETRRLTNDIRSGGDGSGELRAQLEQVAGQFAATKGEVAGLTAELGNHNGRLEETTESLRGMTAPITRPRPRRSSTR
jgi:ABC-type transporter Mla subunit MlaD